MSLEVLTSWENLEFGLPEERACACHLKINLFDQSLTYVEDLVRHETRNGVHVSAYPLAEWLAWNWWRLRWEPRRATLSWRLAHCLTSVGEGYIWPNITVVSDGERVLISAEPTTGSAAEPIRYLSNHAGVIRADAFEQTIDAFVERTLGRLRDQRIPATDLHTVWAELLDERANSFCAERRRLEAILGFDPDEADTGMLERMAAEGSRYGFSAIEEIAATASASGHVSTIEQLRDLVAREGAAGNPRETVNVPALADLPAYGSVEAWRLGVKAANALRESERLGVEPIDNRKLENMLAIRNDSVKKHPERKAFAFGFDYGNQERRIVLRSPYEVNRRFEAARLLGDRLFKSGSDELFIAPTTYTYRQKLQRAFAAELLCPVKGAQEMLGDDASDERLDDIAEYYQVSDRLVRTLLVNNGILPSDSMRIDREPQADRDEDRPAA
ncbi:MAG: hypothetical protein GVY13_17485 [Alphaproteobacteria bacterium]|jgi:Zn-dependent peptidase ImmA (M78 family)|nr:hypothetical protein [Alphaproteobacteria bacterium]